MYIIMYKIKVNQDKTFIFEVYNFVSIEGTIECKGTEKNARYSVVPDDMDEASQKYWDDNWEDVTDMVIKEYLNEKTNSNKISILKLFKCGTMDDGTIRLQSQLSVGKDSVDFLLRPDGTLESWWHNRWVKTIIPFEIIEDINEMRTETL